MEDFGKLLTEWRHHLHEHPEWALEEKETSEFVAGILEEMGLEVHRGIGVTGIVANLTVGDSPAVIGLRADMDAIRLKEMGDHPYVSKNPGMMHACGHDGHTATLLGAARLLSERRNFNGTVRFIFQPGEEPGLGADAMINDGLLERFPMDEVYALHNNPELPEGSISVRKGGIMASEDDFRIRIRGVGGHSSLSNKVADPIVAAAQIILALQTVVSRDVNPLDEAVVSCTDIRTDGTRNAIPSNVEISGDTRSTNNHVRKLLEDRIRTISEGICRAYDMECDIEYTHDFSPTVNDARCTETAIKAAVNVVGAENVYRDCTPVMSSEDFGKILNLVPGCYVFLGGRSTKEGRTNAPLHNSLFDYNDDILVTGAEYFAELVRTRLAI